MRGFWHSLNTGSIFSEYQMTFNGTDEYIDCGNDSSLDFEYTDSFSALAWVTVPDNGLNRCVFSKIASSNAPGYYAYINTGEGLSVHIANSLSNYIRVTSPAFSVDGNPHLYSFSYDGSGLASGVKVYIDAVLQTFAINSDNLASKSILNTAPLEIGSRAGALYFGGEIDDLSIVDKELSQSEMTEAAGTGVPNDLRLSSFSGNLVSYWLMGDGDTISSITDVVGSSGGTPTNMDASNIIEI